MNHIQLLCDISEINQPFTDSPSIESFLEKIVVMVANHMQAGVCSIYLYKDDTQELELSATYGLNRSSIGIVRLKSGEGLTGLAFKEMRPIVEDVGRLNPHFKFFANTAEDQFEAFLAVPIIRGLSRIGVLVVQRERRRVFKDRDITALRAVASQLANMLENARLLITLHQQKRPGTAEKSNLPKRLKGSIASEGFAYGPARIIKRNRAFQNCISKEFPGEYSLEEFNAAIKETEMQLESLQQRIEKKLSDVASLIFTSHLLFLKDTSFIGSMVAKIGQGIPPPQAVITVAEEFIALFKKSDNEYMREKVQDIEDVCIRLLGNLVHEMHGLYGCQKHIVIAAELFPSDLLKLSSEEVMAIVIVTGGVTSHLSILARSLQLPMVIIDSPTLLDIDDETMMLLDAEIGNLFINPQDQIVSEFTARNEARLQVATHGPDVHSETRTGDGTRIFLRANINLLSDLKLARQVTCDGIGLYRTEFPFIIRNDFPSEEEQYAIYQQLFIEMPDQPVTIRTLDIGGDKALSYHSTTHEQNPFLGMRSIRFSLAYKELFHQQLRAILRAGAGAGKRLKIMFPLISSLDEFLEARHSVYTCITELEQEGCAHNNEPLIGVMIEVPSVIAIIDELAQRADFFSIGTNDLIQYLLAVDRTNEKVASLYTPFHPSVLRSLRTIVAAAQRAEKDVSICGEMALQERFLSFFVGIGVRELSIEPSKLPRIQVALGKIDTREAVRFSEKVLLCSTLRECEEHFSVIA